MMTSRPGLIDQPYCITIGRFGHGGQVKLIAEPKELGDLMVAICSIYAGIAFHSGSL